MAMFQHRTRDPRVQHRVEREGETSAATTQPRYTNDISFILKFALPNFSTFIHIK